MNEKAECPICGGEVIERCVPGNPALHVHFCRKCGVEYTRERPFRSDKDLLFAIFSELHEMREMMKEGLARRCYDGHCGHERGHGWKPIEPWQYEGDQMGCGKGRPHRWEDESRHSCKHMMTGHYSHICHAGPIPDCREDPNAS